MPQPDAAGSDASSAPPDAATMPSDGGASDAAAPDAPASDAATPPPDATTGSDGGPAPDPGRQLLSDRRFQRGFAVLDPSSGAPSGTLALPGAPGEPIWELGQWGRSRSLTSAPRMPLPSGAVRWEDRYGSLTIGPPGTEEADAIFHVNAFEEYGGVYRPAGDARVWPHLLGQQRISPPGAAGPGCPPLTELASLDFSVEARLLFDRPHRGPGYDPSRHAASFLIYFTVQNLRDPSAPGYGDYLWLGLTLYDDRDPRPGLYVNGDAGTGKLIYNIGLRPLTDATLSDGAWHTMRVDLLPHALDALRAAWDRGFLPDSRDPADYRIGGMNLGWEIPGLNDAALQVRNLSLTYVSRTGTDGGGTGGTGTPTPVRFDFDTDGDREGWVPAGMEDRLGGPRDGRWILWVPGDDPTLSSPPLALDATRLGTLEISFANDGNPPAASRMQVFWKRRGDSAFVEARSVWIDAPNDGGWRTLRIDMDAHPQWNGTIEQVRIDPVRYGDGHAVGFDWIAFVP